ncbi:MAG: polyketide cyclase [Bacteroidetes bacterium]|nr:MAG: polyketide cyclase [Bacteroidota bacterium]REK05702.1 MAG: polyketide cyclase [Bacteroidota bacterium]REK31992.1 MAG: polyketide cyclase [Bacteroidota bacterium]REK50056.1 MAG: polyketide cyclase [Bacteroidota bacterium]
MTNGEKNIITVETSVNAPIDKVWECWTKPTHITRWYNASDDWHAPFAENDLVVNGKFKTTMAAKDKSAQFDFEGIYTNVQKHSLIEFKISDGRMVKIEFINKGRHTEIIESFEAENHHTPDQQKSGWQAILNNFKKYTES